MTSCHLCTNGWTPEGKPCPNGCRDVSIRNIVNAIPPQTNAPEGFKPPWPVTPSIAKQMRFPPEGPMKAEDLLDLLRLLSAIMAQSPMAATTFPPRKQAHLEWCDNVLAAQTDEGALEPPHVLLNRALIELQKVVAGVTPVVQTEGGPDHDYRMALYKIINRIEEGRENVADEQRVPDDVLLDQVLDIACDATTYD
jgi:hypothetical protein